MRSDSDNTTWTVTSDGEPSDAAISALARLLLSIDDDETETQQERIQNVTVN